jgi:hypothetical protein
MHAVTRTHIAPAILTAAWLAAIVTAFVFAFERPATLAVPTMTAAASYGQPPRLFLSRRMMVKPWATAKGTFGTA